MPPPSDLAEQLAQAPILPTLLPATDAETLCEFATVLAEEGFPALEVLARPFDAAQRVLEEVARRPERQAVKWLIGTITSAEKARQAAALRPDALVSPAFSRAVLDVAVEANLPYVPAVATFQDVQDVLDAFERHGRVVRTLKLCPIYGLTREYVNSLAGCFPGITFCPTGEMFLENYIYWRQCPAIGAAMGSRLVPRRWLAEKDWPAVRRRLRLLRGMADAAREEAAPPG